MRRSRSSIMYQYRVVSSSSRSWQESFDISTYSLLLRDVKKVVHTVHANNGGDGALVAAAAASCWSYIWCPPLLFFFCSVGGCTPLYHFSFFRLPCMMYVLLVCFTAGDVHTSTRSYMGSTAVPPSRAKLVNLAKTLLAI